MGITRNYDLKVAKDYCDYLESFGFLNEYYGITNGDLDELDFYNKELDKQVTLTVNIHDDYLQEILNLPEGTEYAPDLSRYDVTGAVLQSHISTEENFLDGSIGNIYLTQKPNSYYKHDLSLFKYVLSLYTDKGVEHEYYILEKHLEHLGWINSVLTKVLRKADYIYEKSDMFSIEEGSREDSDLCVYFKHPNSHDYFWFGTDCLTGDFVCRDGLDIYGKSEKELCDYLMEEYWKKETDCYMGPFTYLYTPDQTIISFKEWLKSIHNK